MKEILYTTALDTNNQLIRIDNAIKGNHYYCPLCKKELIYRNSGKTGKGSRRPHFAHNELSTNCTAESALHYSFKIFLFEYLKKELSSNHEVIMSWICENTSHKNQANLLWNISSLKIEYNIKECRPDIALFDNEGKLVATIEVIVTHYPDEDALKYYKDNNIVLIQVILSSEDDLNMIESKIQNPDFVDFCFDKNCINYKPTLIDRKLHFYKGYCRSLYRHPLIMCRVEITSIFGKKETLSLNEEEIRISEENGVELRLIKGKNSEEDIVEFPCRRCAIVRNRYRQTRRF